MKFPTKLATLLLGLIVVLAFLQGAEAGSKLKIKKLIKAGLVLGALGSKKLPRVLPIPLPIPVHIQGHKEFAGGHFGNEYYHSQGSHYAPSYGHGSYGSYGGNGGFGAGVYGGGGYGDDWW